MRKFLKFLSQRIVIVTFLIFCRFYGLLDYFLNLHLTVSILQLHLKYLAF